MMRKKAYIGLAFVCLSYWILDSVWSYISFEYNLKKLIFSEPTSYLDPFLLKVPPYQIVSRLMVLILFIILGSIILEFIIKRQAAEKERREVHDTLLTVLNSIDATIYVADMHNHEILFMNRHMIDNFKGNFTGNRCHEIFQNNPESCNNCNNDLLLDESGNPKEVLAWEDRNPVTKAWYVNYARAIKWVDGRIVRLQISTDITQLKDLQEKQLRAEIHLRQVQKMEAIGTLAGGIAHDFNNILTPLMGHTEMAMMDIPGGYPVQDHLKEVLSAGYRAKDLVKQILAFSRQQDIVMKPVKVNIIAIEALKLLRASIPSTIDIQQKLEAKPDSVIADPTQMHQLIINLCTNATHAMSETGGILEVKTDNRLIEHQGDDALNDLTPGEYLILTIRDTGHGMEDAILKRIFEPYYTTKDTQHGTGLGLSVVHGIVKSLNGEIAVDSKPGEGSVFNLYFPMAADKDQEDLEKIPTAILPRGDSHIHILLVDDEKSIVDAVGAMLEYLGYRVTASTSSIEALDTFKYKPDGFDLIITDQTMPNMTGRELAGKIRAIRKETPIILCTGYSENFDEVRAKAMGINAYLMKPILIREIAETIRKVLE